MVCPVCNNTCSVCDGKGEIALTADMILELAEKRLKGHWNQGYYAWYDQGTTNDDCKVCLLGAINWAAHGTPFPDIEDPQTESAMDEALQRLRVMGMDLSLSRWNDKEGRTEEEVIDLLRKARK
jgi:hypothetical protein